MKVTLTERSGWYDYMVEQGKRRLFGTCSDIETAHEGIAKAKATLNRTPLNPRRNP